MPTSLSAMVDLVEYPPEKPVRWFAGTPGAPYRPGSGTEGIAFIDCWCSECARDGEMNGTKRQEDCEEGDGWCEILGRSFRSDEPLPEWIYGDDGQPKCTQFVPMGEPIPAPRDELTRDMFPDG